MDCKALVQVVANNREFFVNGLVLRNTGLKQVGSDLATGLEQPRKEVPMDAGCAPHTPQSPPNLEDLSPRCVKYVWSVAADTGTDLQSCWQSCKHLRSCRSVGSKQPGMFSAHTQGLAVQP